MNQPCCDHMFVRLEGAYRGCWAPCKHHRDDVRKILRMSPEEFEAWKSYSSWDAREVLTRLGGWHAYLLEHGFSEEGAADALAERFAVYFDGQGRMRALVELTCEECGDEEVMVKHWPGGPIRGVRCRGCDRERAARSDAHSRSAATSYALMMVGPEVREWMRVASQDWIGLDRMIQAIERDADAPKLPGEAHHWHVSGLWKWMLHGGMVELRARNASGEAILETVRGGCLSGPDYGLHSDDMTEWLSHTIQGNLRHVVCRLKTWGEYGA